MEKVNNEVNIPPNFNFFYINLLVDQFRYIFNIIFREFRLNFENYFSVTKNTQTLFVNVKKYFFKLENNFQIVKNLVVQKKKILRYQLKELLN